MREASFVPAPRAARSAPRLLLLLALTLSAGSAFAQSFLGTVRGTITDPQGAAVAGATVLIIDQNSGIPRTVESDSQGRYEAAYVRPGTYRVEVVTTQFKKAEKTGVMVWATGTALVDMKLELGNVSETVTVSAESINNITLDSPAISRGFDEQQLRDLPRDNRDIQSFLLLNPNVLGGSDDIQFLGGRTYGVSYIQDGQASSNAIFGTVGNSAPGLDAISEMQVLSNSYSAEYGGLAGVVVTTKRGGNKYQGTAFYDYNSSSLNALTYNQKLSGVERGDPNADTQQDRWGASFGGPLVSGKTFFHAAYEGSYNKAIFGGARGTVPTAALRAGDFSGTTLTIKDPLTGQPFPGNVIPADRLDPSAQKIMNFFYPLPNQGTLSSGFGVYQQFVPKTQNRNRADLRIDHEASKNDSLFLRGSYQDYNNNAVTFEGGNALTNLPILDRGLTTASVVAGWTKIFSPTVVNEFRAGYNWDKSSRQSTYTADQVSSELGLENAPSLGPDRLGFPSFTFSGGSSSSRPLNIVDAGRAVDRTLNQNAFSISDNVSWIIGGHSLKGGGLYTHNTATDGFGIGVNFRGQYQFTGVSTGSSYADFLLGLPRQVRDQVSNRGPLDGSSNDWAFFVKDDWRVNQSLTVFLGLRYELVGTWHENGDTIANWTPDDGGHHVVPNAQIAALLPPGLIALGRTLTADQVGIGSSLYNADTNNWSPRVGFAWRMGGTDKTVLRGGFGLFHPTVAVQGVRDLLATNEFRYINTTRGSTLQHGFSTGSASVDAADFGNQGIDPNIQSPDIYQYNLTIERELPGNLGLRVSYIGSTMRKLLVDRDFNTLPASTTPFNPETDLARLPLYPYGYYADNTANRGSGQFNAGQIEITRRWKSGLALNIAYTYAHSSGNAPDSGNSSIGVVQFDPYDISKDQGPDPNVVTNRVLMNGTWDIPVGHGRAHGANMPGWANALFGGWTVSTIFQARSGNNLTPFFSSFYTTSPWNTGKPLDGLGNAFCCAWRPNQVSNPNTGGTREAFYNQEAYALPAPGELGNAKKGSVHGAGTWVVNFAFYKDIIVKPKFKVQLLGLLDNAFNHPQFFTGYGDGFSQLDSWLIDADPNNGTTGVLGADQINNVEGFAPGRVFRLGLRATF